MRLVWIATKPPAPPVDGGRLVTLLTLKALASEGIEVLLVAPRPPETDREEIETALSRWCRPYLVPAGPRRPLPSAVRSLLGGLPYSIERHTVPEVAAAVEQLVRTEVVDAVHAEQLQALSHAEAAFLAGVPVVLRAQNVESDLWRAAAGVHPWAGRWLAREARRLARHEGEAVRRVSATVALTERDAERLRELSAGGGDVVAVPPPFPSELASGERTLAGEPPVVLLGSGGWLPNRDATRWFLNQVWPEMRAHVSGAILHLFAAEEERPRRLPDGVEPHPPPAESRDAFAPGTVLVVPLRIASGIRMKILEAWARGVPVIATPEAAAGTPAEEGRDLLLASQPDEFARALLRLREEPDLRGRLTRGGKELLLACHEPANACDPLVAIYRRAAAAAGSSR